MASERFYRWSLVTYASENELSDLKEKCLHYAYIFHDNDSVTPHIHFLATFQQQISLSRIKSIISSEQNTLGQRLFSNTAMYSYLTHENLSESEKAVYDSDRIVCDSLDFWTSTCSTKEEENESFITDLINLSPYEMAIKYGRDFIKNFSRYQEFKDILIHSEIKSDFL